MVERHGLSVAAGKLFRKGTRLVLREAFHREAGILRAREELERIMAKNSGKSVETMHADCERDNWMSAEEAKAYGLIDEVIVK